MSTELLSFPLFLSRISLLFPYFRFLLLRQTEMQSSLLLRARAPAVSAPRRGAAVKPLAATAVPTEVIFVLVLESPERDVVSNKRIRLECVVSKACYEFFDQCTTSGAVV